MKRIKIVFLSLNLLLTQHLFAQRDTLFYEDFSDPNLSNWTVVDSTNLGHNWIWSTTAPGGQYSTLVGPLVSATTDNGFISMRADYYNTPWPATGPNRMDAWITSDAIPIRPSNGAQISFQHYVYYCCSTFSDKIEVQVSSDSINWLAYNVTLCGGRSSHSYNGRRLSFDVSPSLANEDTAYVRFRFSTAGWYFWMVDDVAITATNPNALEILAPEFNPFYKNPWGNYKEVPIAASCIYKINTTFLNPGRYDQKNVRLEARLYMDSTLNGGAGSGLISTTYSDTSTVYSFSSRAQSLCSPYLKELFFNAPPAPGYYKVMLGLTSDSIPIAEGAGLDSLFFKLSTDSVLAKEDGKFNSSLKIDYPTSMHNIERVAVHMTLQDSSSLSSLPTATSVSVFISGDSSNIGLDIAPRIWGPFDSLYATNPTSTQIQASMLNSWITLPLNPPLSNVPKGVSFLVGVEQTSTQGPNTVLKVGYIDYSRESTYAFRVRATNVRSNTHSGWFSLSGQAGIRLNYSFPNGTQTCSFVGLEESETDLLNSFSLFPNPSKGIFRLETNLDFDLVEVRDLNGRLVHQQDWNENDQSIDLSFLENGLYFLRLRGDEERVEKILIQK